MKKYNITSPTFTGEINVLYGLDDRLQFIDFMKADLSEQQINWFKQHLPAIHTDKLPDAFGTARLNITEEGYSITFEMWWNLYDLKRNRLRAEKIWNKLSGADRVNAYFKFRLYARHLMLNQWKTKAEPETYLKNRYWENDWRH